MMQESAGVVRGQIGRLFLGISPRPLFTQISQTLRPGQGQPFAVQIQVAEREAAHSRLWFFFGPLYLILSNPKTRF
jgi:hypothetical protein